MRTLDGSITTNNGVSSFWTDGILEFQGISQKLNADEYYAEDLEGVTESVSGSGNLNYLLMQAQLSYETGNILAGEIHGADAITPKTVGASNAGPMAVSADFAENPLTMQGNAFSAGDGQPLAQTQAANATTNNAAGTVVSVASVGGAAAQEAAQVSAVTSQVENNTQLPGGGDGDGDDGGGGGPNDPPTDPHDPFLVLDTDIDLGGTVDDILTQTGDVVNDTVTDVTTILTGGVDNLAGNTVDAVTGLVDNTQGLVDTTQGLIQDVVDAGTFILDNVSLTDPLSNLGNVQEALGNLLDTNALELGLDIRDVLSLDTSLTFGDTLLPSLDITLTPAIGGLEPLTLSTEGLLEDTGVNDLIQGVDDTVATLMDTTPLGDVLGGIEDGLGAITQEVGDQLDTLADGADTLIDNTQDTLENVVDAVVDPVSDLADAVDQTLEPAQDLLDQIVEPVVDLAADTVTTVTDGLGDLLGNDDPTDTDLNVDVGIEAGDVALGIAEDIILDPVEEIIGDVDIDLTLGLDGGGISDLDLTVDADILNTPEAEALLGDLGEAVGTTVDLLNETIAGAEEAIGDLLPGDGPLLGDDLLAGGLGDILPDPGGSTEEGLSGLLDDHLDVGGLGGLF